MSSKVAAKIEAINAATAALNLKPQTGVVAFHVVRDGDGDYMVCEVSKVQRSARVPLGVKHVFITRVEADEQVRRLGVWQAKGGRLTLQTVEVPEGLEFFRMARLSRA